MKKAKCAPPRMFGEGTTQCSNQRLNKLATELRISLLRCSTFGSFSKVYHRDLLCPLKLIHTACTPDTTVGKKTAFDHLHATFTLHELKKLN